MFVSLIQRRCCTRSACQFRRIQAQSFGTCVSHEKLLLTSMMTESTEVTVLEGVVFDSASAFLVAAVLGSARGPVCMVSACSDPSSEEPCKPLGIVEIIAPSFIMPRDPPLESVGIKARRHCNKGLRDVFESHGLIQSSLGAEEYRAWLSRVAYTSDCRRGKNQETTGIPPPLCSIVDEQLVSRRDSIEQLELQTTSAPPTPGQSQDQNGEDNVGGKEGSGSGDRAEEDENPEFGSGTRNLGSTNSVDSTEEEEHSELGSGAQNPGSTNDDGVSRADEDSELGSGTQNPHHVNGEKAEEEEFSGLSLDTQNFRLTSQPSQTTLQTVAPTKNAVIHLIFGDKPGPLNPNSGRGEKKEVEIVPLETQLGGVLSFLSPREQRREDEEADTAKGKGKLEEDIALNSKNEMQPMGVADRETFRNVSKRDQSRSGRVSNVVQYSRDLDDRSERSTDIESDDHLETRIEPGNPIEAGNFSTAIIQTGHELRLWILEQLKLYNGTNETDVPFPLTQEEANLFHDFLEYDVDEVEIASTLELSTILAVRRLLVRLQNVKERQGWFGIIFGISAIVTFVASLILFTKNSRLLVRYAEERACQYRLYREAKRKEKEDKEGERLRRLIGSVNSGSPIIVSKGTGARGREDVEANFLKEPCEPPCQAFSRCETCRYDRRYTESWTEKEVKIGYGAKTEKDKELNIKPSLIPKKLPKPKDLAGGVPSETRALLPPRDSVYPRLRGVGGGVVVDTPPPGYSEAGRRGRLETPSAPIGISPIPNPWSMGEVGFESLSTEADWSFVCGELNKNKP